MTEDRLVERLWRVWQVEEVSVPPVRTESSPEFAQALLKVADLGPLPAEAQLANYSPDCTDDARGVHRA